MIKWLKKLRSIVANHDADMQKLRNACSTENRKLQDRIMQLEDVIRARTNIAVDVGFQSASHVIVVGRYRDADYVQCFSLRSNDLSHLVQQLRDMERYGEVKRVDAPPQFRAVFKPGFSGY